MTVLSIDPGSTQSAYVLWNGVQLLAHAKSPNETILDSLAEGQLAFLADALVIEEIASLGMAVGRDVFQTVRWGARFEQKALDSGWTDVSYIPRMDVKLHLCGQARAKDTNVRMALLDLFGGKAKAVGHKANPGPLHGLRSDEFQALALAITFMETRSNGNDR